MFLDEHNVVTQDLLERCGVLPSSDSARAVDGANRAAGIAVSSPMRHALGPSIRIHVLAIPATIRNRRDWYAASCSR